MSRHILSAVAFALAVLSSSFWTDTALAQKRVALVVGNSAYQHAPMLPNPAKDAKSMADMFQKAGYDVVSAQFDVGNLAFKRAIRAFEDAATDADIAVVYYAGHGIEIHGTNYLVPVDATLASDRDADDEAITLERLVQSVDGAKRLRVIILDACRDNPFAHSMQHQREASIRGINPGLGAAEPSSLNTLIAYAAKAGSAAEDGVGDHSPFTTALLANLFVPGLDVRLAFGRVRDDVLKRTASRQEPFVYGSLGGANVAIVPAPLTRSEVVASTNPEDGVKNDYNLVEKIGTKGAWEVFLAQHPSGFYADLAHQQITKIGLGDQPAPPTGRTTAQPTLASLETPKPAPPPGPTTEEQRAWDKIKDSSDPAKFRAFIKQYPTSVLANIAQAHADALDRAAQEQADKTKQAEAARQQADQAAALARAQAATKAAEDARQKAEHDAEVKKQEVDTRSKQSSDAAAIQKAKDDAAAAELARQQAERESVLKQQEEARQADAACKIEGDRLTTLQAAGSKARDDLQQLSGSLTCERLRPLVTAALDRAKTLPDVNTPDQVRLAQVELTRLGCFAGPADGNLSTTTTTAVQHYETARGAKADSSVQITDDFVTELKQQSARVCPLVCPPGKTADGDQCVASQKSQPVAKQNDNSNSNNNKGSSRHQQQQDTARSAPSQPRVRQEAASVPHGGGGGGGGGPTIGVGF